MGAPIYLRHPGEAEAVAVATGFSWGALLLGFIWALSKRMWFAAFVMLGVNLILFGIGRLDAWDTIAENYRLLRQIWSGHKVTWTPADEAFHGLGDGDRAL